MGWCFLPVLDVDAPQSSRNHKETNQTLYHPACLRKNLGYMVTTVVVITVLVVVYIKSVEGSNIFMK